MKNYIITALALGLGIFLGFIFDRDEVVTKVVSDTKVEYRDTCQGLNVIADVTTETNTVETGGIKKGKSTSTTSTFPVEQVAKQDTDVVTTFSKSYNTGLMRMKVTTTVKAKSAATGKITMEYELDTMTLNSMVNTINTVVISKDTIDKLPNKITKFLPIETTSKAVFLGPSFGLQYQDKLNYQVGLNISANRFGVTLFTNPVDLKQVGVKLDSKLFRIKK